MPSASPLKITAVVGGQFGSEGKGAVVSYLGLSEQSFDFAVRVGAANAGHTIYVPDISGEYVKHVMQQLPCAAYCDPGATLVLGPGAQISPEILREELIRLNDWNAKNGVKPTNIWIDQRAHVITQAQIEEEQHTDLAERIGSTSTIAREGIGAAQAARVMRDADCLLAKDWLPRFRMQLPDLPNVRMQGVSNTAAVAQSEGGCMLLEGTQGTGLSLTTGEFPYTTSRNTTAAGLLADAGYAPRDLERVILVLRTYPIRVAGNSGPFYKGSQEIHWETLGIDSENERTTVTKKVRRVATFSFEQAQESVRINGATDIALTFADYLPPRASTVERAHQIANFVDKLEAATGIPVTYVGTGPYSMSRFHLPKQPVPQA